MLPSKWAKLQVVLQQSAKRKLQKQIQVNITNVARREMLSMISDQLQNFLVRDTFSGKLDSLLSSRGRDRLLNCGDV